MAISNVDLTTDLRLSLVKRASWSITHAEVEKQAPHDLCQERQDAKRTDYLCYRRWILVAVVGTLYIATLTSDYYWDGITFALQIEKVADGNRNASLLFHQNHLTYNALGYLLYKSAQAFGLAWRAHQILQVVNALIGALGIGVFFRIAQQATQDRYLAFVCSVGLAVSAAWWKISTDTNAYILPIVLILVCFRNLRSAQPRWSIAGGALAGAMLVHQLAALFFPVALLTVRSSEAIKQKRKFAVVMSLLAWSAVLSAYYACAVQLHALYLPFAAIKWAISNPSQKEFAAHPLDGVQAFPRSNFDAFFGHNFTLLGRLAGWMEITAVVVGLALGIFAIFKAAPQVSSWRAAGLRQWRHEMRGGIAPVLMSWIIIYAVFLTFWGPLIYFRAFYAPALILALGLVLNRYHTVTRQGIRGAAAFAVAAFACLNFGLYIGINIHPESNELVLSARNTIGLWDHRTVIFFRNRTEADTAFEYFNPQVTWQRLPAGNEQLLGASKKLQSAGGSVWLNKGAMESMGSDWLRMYARGNSIEVKSANGIARYVQLLMTQ
jgi:hypothetical protein